MRKYQLGKLIKVIFPNLKIMFSRLLVEDVRYFVFNHIIARTFANLYKAVLVTARNPKQFDLISRGIRVR
ncbi:hypothetical protein D3C73_1212070 [compost metagenome]